MKKGYTEKQAIGAIERHEAGARVDEICCEMNVHDDGAKDVVGQLVARSISGHQVA